MKNHVLFPHVVHARLPLFFTLPKKQKQLTFLLCSLKHVGNQFIEQAVYGPLRFSGFIFHFQRVSVL